MNLIEICPLNEFEASEFKKLNFNNIRVYVAPLKTVTKLLSMDLPIKNTRIAIINILEFLSYADYKMQKKGTTLINISTTKASEFFNTQFYPKYINILKELKVMNKIPREDGSFYEVGKASLQYRFYNEYVNDKDLCLVFIPSDKPRIEKITYPVHYKFLNSILNTEAYIDKLIKAEIDEKNSPHSLRCRLSAVFNLSSLRYIKKGYNVDRIYHSFSRISRVSRKFLHVRGIGYNDVDIVNCQPLLLAYHIKSINHEIDDNYLSDCQNGSFYENFYNISGKFRKQENGKHWYEDDSIGSTNKDRDKIKGYTYSSIFFGFNSVCPINKRFSEIYPKVHKVLVEINENYQKTKKNSLATILQNIEASVFNDILPKKSKYFYTLFDSIYYTYDGDREDIEHQLLTKFSQFDLVPKFKINECDGDF